MRSLWRRFMAWLNEPDEIEVQISSHSFGRYVDGTGRWIPVLEGPAECVVHPGEPIEIIPRAPLSLEDRVARLEAASRAKEAK